MTNHIFNSVVDHLQDPQARIVAMVGQSGCKAPVYSSVDLPNIKPEGSGLRIGRVFVFACQVRFARVAPRG